MSARDGAVVWITGLSNVGKTTLARAVVDALAGEGRSAVLLDGDELRAMLPDLGSDGYTRDARLRRAHFYARLGRALASQGHIVVTATISLFHDVQMWNRAHVTHLVEVLLRAPHEELVERDARGVYASDADVVGVDIAPEYPLQPELVLSSTDDESLRDGVAAVLAALAGEGVR